MLIMIQLDNSMGPNCDTRPPRCGALECRQCDAAIMGSNLAQTTSTNLRGRIYGEKFDMLINVFTYTTLVCRLNELVLSYHKK